MAWWKFLLEVYPKETPSSPCSNFIFSSIGKAITSDPSSNILSTNSSAPWFFKLVCCQLFFKVKYYVLNSLPKAYFCRSFPKLINLLRIALLNQLKINYQQGVGRDIARKGRQWHRTVDRTAGCLSTALLYLVQWSQISQLRLAVTTSLDNNSVMLPSLRITMYLSKAFEQLLLKLWSFKQTFNIDGA